MKISWTVHETFGLYGAVFLVEIANARGTAKNWFALPIVIGRFPEFDCWKKLKKEIVSL